MGNFINFSLVNLLPSHSEEEFRGDIWVKKEEKEGRRRWRRRGGGGGDRTKLLWLLSGGSYRM